MPKQRELSTPPDGVLWVWYSLPIRAVSHGGIKRVHRCVLYSELLDINIVNWRYQCTVLFVDVQRAAAVSVCLSPRHRVQIYAREPRIPSLITLSTGADPASCLKKL